MLADHLIESSVFAWLGRSLKPDVLDGLVAELLEGEGPLWVL